MNSAGVKHQLFAIDRVAIGQANINARELKSISLPVPPVDLQRRYADTIEAAVAVARVRESSTRTAAAVSLSLMAWLLRDVREATLAEEWRSSANVTNLR